MRELPLDEAVELVAASQSEAVHFQALVVIICKRLSSMLLEWFENICQIQNKRLTFILIACEYINNIPLIYIVITPRKCNV